MRLIEARKIAGGALKKRSAFGPDVDPGAYRAPPKKFSPLGSPAGLPEDAMKAALAVGVDGTEACRSGTFIQIDHSVVFSSAHEDGLEVMEIDEALKKHGWLSDHYWKLIKPDADRYTAEAAINPNHGYFIRALPGARAEFPLQACLYMTAEGMAQNVHNVIVAEEGSELHIITGCTTGPEVSSGLHIGVSEFYVKKNATLSFTMIHGWAEGMAVRPRSAAHIEEGGLFLSNYICMRPVRTLQMYPTAYCAGRGSTARLNTVLFVPNGSDVDVGAKVVLSAGGARAEVLTRAVSTGGRIVARGCLVGEKAAVKGHLECRGLVLSKDGSIHAVPELDGRTEGVELSHEAAVGKIAQEELTYLMARGLTDGEATAAIIRGFLDVEIKGLPEHLKAEVKKAVHAGGPGEGM